MPYAITLQDPPEDITERAQREAEQRFRRTLEKALGGADAVPAAHRAWQTAQDTTEGEMSPEEITLARRWIAATTTARSEGLKEIGEGEAWFEVRMER